MELDQVGLFLVSLHRLREGKSKGLNFSSVLFRFSVFLKRRETLKKLCVKRSKMKRWVFVSTLRYCGSTNSQQHSSTVVSILYDPDKFKFAASLVVK